MAKTDIWHWRWDALKEGEKLYYSALARAAEDSLYLWGTAICGLDRPIPRIHEPLTRFMSLPVLKDNMPDAAWFETDWVEGTNEPVKRGDMRGGDFLGEPFVRETRISTPPKSKQLIRVPRGCYKTAWIAAMILWLLMRDVNKSVMVMAVDDQAAAKILAWCDRHVRANPLMAHFWQMNEWVAEPWTVMQKFIATRTCNRANDPSMWATSPGSVKAGPHPDYVFIDDIINDKVIASDEKMAKANAAYDSLSPMLTKDSIVWVTGTPWSKLDLYASLARRKAGNSQFMFDIYTRDSINPDGTFWFSELLDEDFLMSKWHDAQEANKPGLAWSQYRMQPVDDVESSLMLERVNWVQADEVDKMLPFLRKIGGIDPADEQAGSGAWAMWAWGTTAEKHFWDIDLQKFSAKADIVSVIVRWIVQHSLEVCVMENTVISRRLIPDIESALRENGVRCAIVKVEPHSINKIRRIRELENGFGSVMAQRRLHLRDSNVSLKNELRTFPGGEYTYDGMDVASYVTSWAMANGFFPRRPKAVPVEKPKSLDERILDHYHEGCDEALKRRDQLTARPKFRWVRPGVREAVRA